MSKHLDLTQGDIGSLIKKIAIPSSIGFLFNTLFNIVDTLYASYIGSDAVSGLTLSFPLFFILISIGSGMGTGTTALISNLLGEKNTENAREISEDSISLGIILSFFVTFLGFFLTNTTFRFLNAPTETTIYGVQYIHIIIGGSLFFILNSSFNAILSAQGDTKPYRNFLMIGFFLNLILDPLFILAFDMGIAGLALATVFIQIIGSFYLLKKVIRSPLFSKVKLNLKKPDFHHYLEILKQGFPASLNMMSMALGVFVINYFVLDVGGSSAVAGYGISMRVEQMALLPTIGLNIAILSITGQNFGAKNFDRIKKVYKLGLIYGLIIMTTAMFIIFPFSKYFLRLFTKDLEVIKYGVTYLNIETFAFNSYVFLNISVAILQGFKKPNFVVFIGVYRQFLLPLLLFPVLISFFPNPIYGVWVGILIVNWSAVIILVSYTIYMLKTSEKDAH